MECWKARRWEHIRRKTTEDWRHVGHRPTAVPGLVSMATARVHSPTPRRRYVTPWRKDGEIRCQTASELRADLKRLKRDSSSNQSEAAESAPAATAAVREAPKEPTSDSSTLPASSNGTRKPPSGAEPLWPRWSP
jgi:hypothetical protein